MSKIVGREKELSALKEAYETDCSEFICVYGRRRVGKTFLITESYEDDFDFYYTGIYKIKNKIQLSHFACELKFNGQLKDWFTAFAELKKYLISLKKTKYLFL